MITCALCSQVSQVKIYIYFFVLIKALNKIMINPDFKDYWSECDKARKLECLRLLNEIVCEFDKVRPN